VSEEPSEPQRPPGGLDPDRPGGLDPDRPGGLDPDRAIEQAAGPGAARPLPRQLPPEIARTTRRYQAMIGGFGLLLVIAFSIYLYANNGVTAPGIAPGKALHRFVAPLATSDLNVSANANPRCNPARPSRRGLNVCGRTSLVLDLFATGAGPCVRSVDTLQRLAARFPGVQFAAVAVDASKASAEALVRSHHWTIPVAYDSDGAIEQIYGVAVCPLIELAHRGTIEQRLIGKDWIDGTRLAAQVQRLEQAG
jgi:thiol-disulfide isomerase/thioredoxin